jgi:hypothetical protein
VLLTSQNLVLPVRLLPCGPPVALQFSVKNSVNDGLRGVEHQIHIWCSRQRRPAGQTAALAVQPSAS